MMSNTDWRNKLRQFVEYCEQLEAQYQRRFDRSPNETDYGSKHAASECAQVGRVFLEEDNQ